MNGQDTLIRILLDKCLKEYQSRLVFKTDSVFMASRDSLDLLFEKALKASVEYEEKVRAACGKRSKYILVNLVRIPDSLPRDSVLPEGIALVREKKGDYPLPSQLKVCHAVYDNAFRGKKALGRRKKQDYVKRILELAASLR